MTMKRGTKVDETQPPFRKGGTVKVIDEPTSEVCVHWPDGSRTWNRPGTVARAAKARTAPTPPAPDAPDAPDAAPAADDDGRA